MMAQKPASEEAEGLTAPGEAVDLGDIESKKP
jgi:hypothetical protein